MGRITLWGFYCYDPELFSAITLPASLDNHILIDLIMERSGMLYPYTQALPYLKINITNWFTRKLSNFTRMVEVLEEKYNPIENYDRQEEWTDTPNIEYIKSGSHTSTITNQSNGTSENQVSAYNTAAYSPDSKQSGTSSGTSDETVTYNGESTTETGDRRHAGRVHGNIGVTTNQQMIQSELELRKFDIYQYISAEFENDLLMQVY